METKPDPQCFNNNEVKLQSAIGTFRVHSASRYQKLMMQAGLSGPELTVNCPTYLLFIHIVLLTSFQNLYKLKTKLSHCITEDEHKYLNLLTVEGSSNEDPRLNVARNSFVESLPNYLKKIMKDTGFEDFEIEDNNANFISFLSEVLIMEAEKLFRIKSVVSESNKNKKRTVDECFKQESSAPPLENIDLSTCPVQAMIETKRHDIYCLETPDGLRAVKLNNAENPTIEDTQNLDNELKIGSEMKYHAFRKSYAMTMYHNKKALVLEWAEGNPLSDVNKLAIPHFLKVSREIVSCLIAIHGNKICHLNLTCDHVILNSESDSVKIIGCGSSSSSRSKRCHNLKFLEKDLRYISPEQTGRVNREVDYRSDLYSLGIIFYRLLTGHHPFDSPNAIKIVQMHLFQNPLPLHQVDPNIPLPLSNMVSKLMEKDVDSRYKSAKGIMHDIDLIISDFKPGVQMVLAQHDIPETVLLPQKLYGRANEYSTLFSAYNRAVSSSSFELVLVRGKSGGGKSSFVRELNKHAMKNEQIFICGKYDCSKSEPYSALIEAVKMLCDIIALEDETTLVKYRSKIQDAVGEEGKLLTNVVDSLHAIIGKQPEIFESFGAEAKNRFNYVFVKFIKAITSISCPLVLCLDDLQWIDLASLDLLKALVEGSVNNLLLIGNYRDNEVEDEHKLVNFIKLAKKMNISTTEIKINDMDHECINEFLSDALNVSPFDSYPLTAFILKKTNGNPFFVKQIVKDLLEKELITYDYEQRKWIWDIAVFEGMNVSENVVDLLKQKMETFDMYTIQALKIASCLGGTFSLSSIALVINNRKGVEDALATGMITQCKGSDTACFAHDQVKHAAQSLLPSNPKKVFLYAARKLFKLLSPDDLKDEIYTVVNLFDRSKDIINDSERHDVTNLFQLAGEKAMESTAPDEAFEYFKSCIEMLEKNSWKTRYEFALKLYCNAAKASYCLTNYTYMNRYNKQVFENAKTPLDLVTPYLLLIRMYTDKRMHTEALDNTSIILNKLGESINLNRPVNSSEIVQTKNLVGEAMEKIMEIKEMNDTKLLSVMEVMSTICLSTFISGNRQAYASLALKMVQLTMKDGLSKYSSPAFCHFSVVLRGIGDKSSYEFGKLSLKLLEKAGAKEMIPVVNVFFFSLISPFYTSLHKSLDPLRIGAVVSVEIGSHHFVTTIVAGYFLFSFLCGVSLSKLLDEFSEFEEVLVTKTKTYSSLNQTISNLYETSNEDLTILSGEKFDYKYCLDKNGVKFDIAHTSLIGAINAYLFYDYDTASQLLKICKPLLNCLDNFFIQTMFYFYDGLVTATQAQKAKSKLIFVKTIEEDILVLKQYAKNAPENYLHKVHLLEAELAVVCKKHSEAESYYQKAVTLSNKHGLLNDEAVACERCAMFLLEVEQRPKGVEKLCASYDCYKKWKADSKMRHLVQTYQFLEDALKDSSPTNGEGCKVLNGIDCAGSVSVLTNSSSASISTWQEQKRSRLSLSKCDNS